MHEKKYVSLEEDQVPIWPKNHVVEDIIIVVIMIVAERQGLQKRTLEVEVVVGLLEDLQRIVLRITVVIAVEAVVIPIVIVIQVVIAQGQL